MGYILSERPPNAQEKVTDKDYILEPFRRFLLQLDGIIKGSLSINPALSSYVDKAALEGTIKNPFKGQTAITDDAGLVFFDGSIWRKADNTVY